LVCKKAALATHKPRITFKSRASIQKCIHTA
jgi:hypothetical protein